MPNWGMHLHLADSIIENVPVRNRYEFLMGSIFPDAPWTTLEDAMCSGLRSELHCTKRVVDGSSDVAVVNDWLIEYRGYIRQYDFFKGALTHIILDNELNTIWNLLTVRHTVNDFCSFTDSSAVHYTLKDISEIKWKSTRAYTELYCRPLKGLSVDLTIPTGKGYTVPMTKNLLDTLRTRYSLIDKDIRTMCSNVHNMVSKQEKETIEVPVEVLKMDTIGAMINIAAQKSICLINAICK